MHSMHNAVAILTSHVSTMTVVVSTLSSIWCLPISLYKTTMPIGLDRLLLSMCKRCATGETVGHVRSCSLCQSGLSASRALG